MKKIFKVISLTFLLLLVSSFSPNLKSINVIKTDTDTLFTANLTTKVSKREIKNIAVFIEFNDSDKNVLNHLDDDQSVANAYKIFNNDQLFEMNSVKGIINVPSFKKYFEQESYGNLSIITEIFPKVNGKVVSYQDSRPIGYYLKYNDQNPIGYKNKEEASLREKELLNSATMYIKNQISNAGISAEDLDTDNDGFIDAISFIIEGQPNLPSSIAWGDLLWSHESANTGISEEILGKKVNAYTLLYANDYTETAGLFSLNRGNYGTIIHEFGHVLGYKDLYKYGNSKANPVGFYDIMGDVIGSNPQSFLTYFISEYNINAAWHNPLPVITKTTDNITLYKPKYIDQDEKRAIKIQVGGNNDEYFIVEYHNKMNTYETHSAQDNGLILYRVNEKNKYLGNSDTTDHIYVFRPGETGLGNSEGDLSLATLNMKRNTYGKELKLNDNTFDNQSIFFADGTNSGIEIIVTNETTDSITFNVKFPKLEGDGTQNNPYLIKDVNTFLYLMSLNTTNKYYKMVNNLDFSTITDYPLINFEGNLDGNFKTLSNITINNSGIFNNIGNYNNHTKIENLYIDNLKVYSNKGNFLGGFANVANNVTLYNIRLKSGTLTNDGVSVNSIASSGGFVGNISDTTIIDNCSSKLDVNAKKNVGGFIGLNQNATIKNSFSEGIINGETNVGGFIGMQYINDIIYKVPEKTYYKDLNDQNLPSIGGFTGSVHDLATLSEGIVRISIPATLEIALNEKINIPLTTYPNINISYNTTIDDNSILKVENDQIVALNFGSTNIYFDVIVGLEKMQFTTNIIVKKSINTLTEAEGLQKLGLSKYNNYITGFTLGSNIKDLKNEIIANNITLISFKNASNIEINDGIISTGMKFTLEFNNVRYDYIVVIKGDVNGDGLIYATDYVKVKNHIMGKTILEEPYLLAADTNNDRNIYATDYVQIKNHIMGKNIIQQSW